MAVTKYLDLVAGIFTQKVTIDTSAGSGDAGKIPSLDAAGLLSSTFMPVGIGADIDVLPTSENLAAGDMVNIYNLAGAATVRKADATAAGKECDGYVIAGVTSPANASVYRAGSLTGLSGLTPGNKYYLHTTAGGTTGTAPSGSANVVQYVGKAKSATELAFERGVPVTLV